MNVLHHLPNLLTLTNLSCGLAAVYSLMSDRMEIAMVLLLVSLLADVLDGFLARRLGVADGIGVQLDSLADLISFCVLPATGLYHIITSVSGWDHVSILALIPPCILVASAAFRLARFNVDTRPREWFWGLATPAAAIGMMGYIWAFSQQQIENWGRENHLMVSLGLCLIMAMAYQINLKLPGLKSPKKGKLVLMVVGCITILSSIWFGSLGLTIGILAYLVLGVINLAIRWY